MSSKDFWQRTRATKRINFCFATNARMVFVLFVCVTTGIGFNQEFVHREAHEGHEDSFFVSFSCVLWVTTGIGGKRIEDMKREL